MAHIEINPQEQNPTVYSDKPVTGGETKLVINELQIRQAIQQTLGILNWRTSTQAAKSRYYPNRTRLYDIYEDILFDTHLSGIIQKRIDTVLNKELAYEKPDGEVHDAMNPFIQTMEFRNLCRHILNTQLWGITGIEFIPGATLQPRLIPRKHIKTRTQKITIEQNDQDTGIDYTTLDNVWVIGDPEDLGLLSILAPMVIYKRGMMGDWAQYIEVFGMPIRTMYYDANDQQAKIELKQILDKSGSALALMIPKGVEFKLEDGKTSNGDGALQETFLRILNSEMSITTLGNTETTNSSKSSGYAQSKTHSQQQNEITKSDIQYLQYQLNNPHFLKILKSYGFPLVEGGRFKICKEIDIDFLLSRSQVDKALLDAGVTYPQSYFEETYNIPKPEAGEEIVGEEEEENEDPGNGQNQPKPPKKTKKSPADLADGEGSLTITASQLSDMMDKKFADFFAQAL